MSILNLGILNSIKNGVNSLISSVGKGTNSQTLTLKPGVQTTTNIFDVSDVNAIIAIRQDPITVGDIECVVRYHAESGEVSFVGETINFSAQSAYEQKEIRLKASRVSFRLTNNGEINKNLVLTLSKTALKNISNEINVVSLFDDSSVELPPLDTTISSKEFEFDSDYVRIGFYGLSGTFPANLQITARYAAPSGSADYVSFDPDVVTEVKSGVNEGVLIKLKYRKVSFRFRNISESSFTLSRIVASKVSGGNTVSPDEALYTREKQIQSLFSRDSVVLEPGDTEVFSDILEINGEYGVVGMRGAIGTPSTPIEITPRYHGQGSDVIFVGDPVFTNVASVFTGKVAAVIPMIHKRVSFRIVNRGDTAITINNAVISPRDTDPNGNSLNFPLSPDGAMYVQLKDGVDSAAYDAFYGSLKTLRTYKPDFRIVVAPPTPKTTATDEVFEYSLQNGADHVRIYLKVTVTGNPFPDENDGVSLNIFYKDEPFETLAMTGNKIKTGSSVYLLGKTLNEIQSVDALFGDDIKVILKTTGTIDASNNFTYEIVSYQKFK
jgi:hypothetical protein